MLSIYYPKRNLLNCSPVWQQRLVSVWSIRDLVTDPLTVEEYLARPLVRRSRYLWQVKDSQNQWRSFYQGASLEQFRDSCLRLALYNGSNRIKLLARPFESTVRDRVLLARVASRWADLDYGGLQLRITCDDMRLVAQ
jgi:hypothetical protein